MEKLLEHFPEVISWIGDSPFRLFAVLSLFAALILFLFFRSEGAGYKLVVTIMLFASIGIFGNVFLINQKEKKGLQNQEHLESKASESSKIEDAEPPINLKVAKFRNLLDEAVDEQCIETAHSNLEALNNSFPTESDSIIALKASFILLNAAKRSKKMLRRKYLYLCKQHSGLPLRGPRPGSCENAYNKMKQGLINLRAKNFEQAIVSGNSSISLWKVCEKAD